MAGSVNKVILIGHLGADPEIRATQSGSMVANLRIATNEYWTGKDGQKGERTEWHRVVCWGKQADLVEKYLSKGRQIYLEGRLQTRSWEDQQGQKRYSTEIVANQITFLGSAGAGGRHAGGNAGLPDDLPPPPAFDSSEDDIPF